VAKLILPETGEPETGGAVPPAERGTAHASAMGALAAGAWDGLRVAAGISVILIAILGVVGLIDAGLAALGSLAPGSAAALTLEGLLGALFRPVAWLLGIPSQDLAAAGKLLGERLVVTEVVAYRELGGLAAAGGLSARTVLVLSYALCGFAHVAGMGIAVGGFAALAPERLDDLASLGLRALAAATLATLLTGALAGVFYHGQAGLLGL
jgi:CNT family concentrative nucleoside transporter